MPELPEAETIVRDLRTRVRGAVLTGASVTWPDVLAPGLSPRRLARELRGKRILDVDRRGKAVVLELSDDARLVISLGMTGRIVSSQAPAAAGLRHIAVRFPLDDGRVLLYDDARRFGRIALLDSAQWNERNGRVGIEPLSAEFTADLMFRLTRNSIVALRNWLLDQRRVAGVGNIYANEALFRAGVRPTRRARKLKRREAALLRDAIRDVLQEAIEARGTTLNDYRDADGVAGGFEPRLRVYGREGEPCVRCGTPIRRVAITNRSAFYCPSCQL